MRKLVVFFLSITLLLTLSITAYAEESPTNIDVYARYIRQIAGEYMGELQNGEASITTDEDVTINVTGAPEEALSLVVVPIPAHEKEAQAWIASCLECVGTPTQTYDIYFVDRDGNRFDADGAVVTIDCPSYGGALIVCSLTKDGVTHGLDSTIQSGRVTFTTDGSPYYVLAEKEAFDDEPTPEYPDSPATGDISNPWLWIILLTLSAACLFWLLIGKRRKKENDA